MSGTPVSIAHGGKFVANDNGLPVSVVGSLPKLPSYVLDIVGVLNSTTGTITNGSTIIPPSTSYYSPSVNTQGNTKMLATAVVSGTSPTWTLMLNQSLPNKGTLTSINKTSTTVFAATTIQDIMWPITSCVVQNTSATENLTLQYLGLGVQ